MGKYDWAYVGIDPGLDGWVVVLNDSRTVLQALRVPTVREGKKRGYHIQKLVERLRRYDQDWRIQICVLEQQQAMTGQGVVATFSTGYNMGLWEGVLSALGLPYERVRAMSWKKALDATVTAPKGTSQTQRKKLAKEASVAVASRLFPKFDLVPERCRVPDHNLADALLLAEYGRRAVGGNGA